MSLRTIHMLFMMLIIIITEMFGAWAFWRNAQEPETALVVVGSLSLAAGFGVIVYAIWFVRKAERSQVE